MVKKINIPISEFDKNTLKAGDEVLLSGTIYTARDAAHKKIIETGKAPINLKNQVIYYTGPTPCPPGKVIGSCGPTTSSRMDKFTSFMLEEIGIQAMIGKGKRSTEVRALCKKNKAMYFIAPGGCGALLADKVKSMKVIAYPELLSEAIYMLEIKDFPAIVGIDINGNDIYK